MANVRLFALLLVLVMVVHCALARARNYDDLTNREKRLFFGCAKIGSRCTGVMSKSCCSGTSCNTTSGKCVAKGSATSWLGDRDGK